jgi:hypothetical protein
MTINPSHDQPRAKTGTFANRVYGASEITVNPPVFRRSPMPKRSPWGMVEKDIAGRYDATELAPGIWQVGTAGHGGWKLSAQRNAEVHELLRSADGWYEEDGDYKIPMLTFCDELEPLRRQGDPEDKFGRPYLEAGIRDQYPDEWEEITGTTVEPGQSSVRDRREFVKRTRTLFVSSGAIRRNDGQVRLWVRRVSDDTAVSVVVPSGDYDNQPMVVDLDQYMQTSDAAEKFLGEAQMCVDLKSPDSPTVEFWNEQAALPRKEEAIRSYNQEMLRLNPVAWLSATHPAKLNWEPAPLVARKRR